MHSNFLHIENNHFVGSNGVIGAAYLVELPQKYSLSEQDFDLLVESWAKAFAMLENAIILKSDIYLTDTFDTQNYPCANFLQQATQRHFQDREYLKHFTYLFFLKADFDTYFNRTWYNPFKKVSEDKFKAFEDAQNAFFTDVEHAVNYLEERKLSQGQKLNFHPMKKELLLSYEDLFFSGLAQGFTTNVFTQDSKVYAGDKLVGVFSVNNENNLPPNLKSCITDHEFSSASYKFHKNYADNFSFNLNFSHIYNQIFFIDNSNRVIRELESTRDNLFKNRSWNTQNDVSSKETTAILEDLLKNDERRVIRGAINLIIFEQDPKEYKRQMEQIVSAFNDIDIKPHYSSSTDRIKSDYFLSFPVFTPFMNDKQLFKIPLDCASCLIQNTSHYKEDKEGLIFNSRVQNIPLTLDNYFADKKYDNARNSIVIAPTGHGKSTLINHLVRHYFERNDKIVILDYGGSYKKFHLFYENQVSYITYEENKPLGYNIFDLGFNSETGHYEALNSQQIQRITNYILIHTSKESHTEEEFEVLKKIIDFYYTNEIDRPSFHRFYDFLELSHNKILDSIGVEEKYFDIKRFMLLIQRFSSKGTFHFLYQETDYNILEQTNKAITIFEFENASTDKTILALLLYLSDIIIDTNILKDASVRGHIIFDEIAKMYKFEGIADKVELHYQTVRKKEAEITQVLQTIHQLPETSAGRSIIENTQVLYVLNAKDYQPIQKVFNLSDHAVYQMQSLQSKLQGEAPLYTEIFIMRGKNHAVYRLELPLEVFWAYQTDGVKNLELMQQYDQVQDMQKAIENIIDKKEK